MGGGKGRSAVGTATRYGLDGQGIESRWRRNFPHPSRPELGPTQPPIQWVPGHSKGVKRPGRGVDHPPPSNAEVKERVELYLYSFSGSSWPVVWWNLPLPEGGGCWQPPPLLLWVRHWHGCKSPKDHFHVSNLATIQIQVITANPSEGQHIPLCHLYISKCTSCLTEKTISRHYKPVNAVLGNNRYLLQEAYQHIE